MIVFEKDRELPKVRDLATPAGRVIMVIKAPQNASYGFFFHLGVKALGFALGLT